MKKIILGITLTILIALPSSAFAYQCGLRPLKPLVPLGCNDLVAQCVCSGSSCYWQWICVQ